MKCQKCGAEKNFWGADLCLTDFTYYGTKTGVMLCGVCNHAAYNLIRKHCATDEHACIYAMIDEFVDK